MKLINSIQNFDSSKLGGANSLNTIRLLAALEVLYGHTIIHLQIGEIPYFDPIIRFFSGVPIFFTMSGFLIWESIGRSKNYKEFLMKRFWRIYPELWVAVIVEILVLLLLYDHSVDFKQFLFFIFGQFTLFQFWTPDCLREYGCGCPNGALWTICVIIQFYIISFFIYKFLHGKKTLTWVVFILFSFLLSMVSDIIRLYAGDIYGKFYDVTICRYLWMFLIASFVAEKKNCVLPFVRKNWIFIILLLLIANYFNFDIDAGYRVVNTSLLFLGVLGAAYTLPQFNIKTDISYAVYIYHMTIVNALIEMGYLYHKWLLLLVVLTTVLISWLSTISIGRWALSHKKQNNK